MSDAPDGGPIRTESRVTDQSSQTAHPRAGKSEAPGLLSLALLGLAMLWSLGAVPPTSTEQYVWSLFLLMSVGYFLALERGFLHCLGLRFLTLVAVMSTAALALPYLTWSARAGELAIDTMVWPILTVCLLAPGAAAIAHLSMRTADEGEGRRKGRWSAARRSSGLISFALMMTLGTVLLTVLHGGYEPGSVDSGLLSLAGRSLTVAVTGLLLLRCADRINSAKWTSRTVILLPVLAVLGALVAVLFHMYGSTVTEQTALVAIGATVVLVLTFPTSATAMIGLTALIGLIPWLPGLLDLAYAVGTNSLAGSMPLLLVGVLAAAILLDQRVSTLTQVIFQGRQLDRLRARLEPYGSGQLLYADLMQKRISRHEPTTGRQSTISFSRFFRHARPSEILDLLEALRGGTLSKAERAFPVHISTDPFSGSPAEQGQVRPAELHVLEHYGQQAWLGLMDASLKSQLQERVHRAERALGEAIVREERLLSVAAHELRTPLSVLLMLSEELDAGTTWGEVAPNFQKSLERMTSLLDDLRVRNSKDDVHMVQTNFTLREIALHLQEVFTGSAQANGIALLLGMSQQGDTLIISDYGRVFIALSKLIHNAIIHSHGSEVTISVFLTRQSEGRAIVTWQVSDNGRGISPERYETVFRPFDTDGFGQDGERPGLGLYTARKAVQAMGGDLSMRRTSDIGAVPRRLPPFSTASGKSEISAPGSRPGATFVLKHPARLAVKAKHETLEQLPVTETEAKYSDKVVLLIEDNQIVGEITVTRLRRLFGKTVWSQDGEDALVAYETNKPDLMLVDQLLPGMLGSDVVKRVREVDSHLPIIGITASTLGSEVAELEASGANYALEKPLSIQQIHKIAEEFFGSEVGR